MTRAHSKALPAAQLALNSSPPHLSLCLLCSVLGILNALLQPGLPLLHLGLVGRHLLLHLQGGMYSCMTSQVSDRGKLHVPPAA